MAKVTFKELSIPLKAAVIVSWIVGLLYLFAFLVGFIEGFLGL